MTFAFVDFFWLCTLIAIMIFQCCAVANTSKKFSDVVVFQFQLKAAEQYFLFLSFFFLFQMKAPEQFYLLVLFIIPHKVKF